MFALRLPILLGFISALATHVKQGIDMMPEPLTLGIFGVCLFVVAAAVRGREFISNQAQSSDTAASRDLEREDQPIVRIAAVRADSQEIPEQLVSQ